MSNVDHHEGAVRRGPAATAHTGVSVKNLYPHVPVRHSDGSVMNFPASSQLILHSHEIDTTYVASSATEQAFQSGGFVDVRVAAGSAGIITGATLEFRVRSGEGGVSVMPVPFALALERVEVILESGNCLLSRHESTQLLWPMRHLSQVAIDMLAKPMGYFSDISATSGPYPGNVKEMVKNSEETFYVPLFDCPLVTNHVFGGGLKSDMYFRIWFRGPNAFFTNGGPIPTLRSMNLIITQQSLSPRDRAQLAYKYASESLCFRFQRPGVQVIRAAMQPSQRYAFQLTALLGLCTEIAISVLVPYIDTANGWGYRKMASFEILDGSGANIVGGGPIASDYHMLVKGSRKAQSRSLDTNLLESPHSERVIFWEAGDSKANQEAGVVTGYLVGDGSLQLAITTPANLTPGDYELRVEFLTCARLNINRGTCSVFPS